MKKLTEKDVIERVALKHQNKVKYMYGFVNTYTKCHWKCDEGHEWDACPSDIFKGRACPTCAFKRIHEGNVKPSKEVINKINVIHEGRVQYVSGYVNTTIKCKWKCKNEHEWEATPASILQGRECPTCAWKHLHDIETTSLKDALQELKEKTNDTIEYISGYYNLCTPCLLKCKNCGWKWETALYYILKNGTRCPKCAHERIHKNRIIPLKEVKQRIKTLTNAAIEYISGYVNCSTKCKWKCVKENHIWEARPQDIMQGSRCPKCVTTSMERPVIEALENKKINYLHDTPLKDCIYNKLPLRPDFYIETQKGILWLECDGQQHHLPMFGKDLSIIQARDKFKDNYCKEHHICLIRVTSSIKWGTEKHITLQKILELIEMGINSETGEIDFDLFWRYDFNRE